MPQVVRVVRTGRYTHTHAPAHITPGHNNRRINGKYTKKNNSIRVSGIRFGQLKESSEIMICRDQQHVAPATATNQQPKASEMGDQFIFRYPSFISLTLITGTLIAIFCSPDSLTTLPGLLHLLVLWLRMHHAEVL